MVEESRKEKEKEKEERERERNPTPLDGTRIYSQASQVIDVGKNTIPRTIPRTVSM